MGILAFAHPREGILHYIGDAAVVAGITALVVVIVAAAIMQRQSKIKPIDMFLLAATAIGVLVGFVNGGSVAVFLIASLGALICAIALVLRIATYIVRFRRQQLPARSFS